MTDRDRRRKVPLTNMSRRKENGKEKKRKK